MSPWQRLPRRRLLARALALVALAGLARHNTPAWAADSALPVPVSLRDAGREAAARGEPLVLLVSLPGCPYCELVRRNYLLPARAEGLQAWQIDVTDAATPLRDFNGAPATGAGMAKAWKAGFTPTVLFLDAMGAEIAPRLVGVANADFYGAYLDEALAAARKVMSARR